MVYVKKTPIVSGQDMKDIQQPLDYKTGWSNPTFDKLYGHRTKNPYHGTERDIKNRKGDSMISIPQEEENNYNFKLGDKVKIIQHEDNRIFGIGEKIGKIVEIKDNEKFMYPFMVKIDEGSHIYPLRKQDLKIWEQQKKSGTNTAPSGLE
jgi:hypothetical protein